MKLLRTPQTLTRETGLVLKYTGTILEKVCAIKGDHTLENTLFPINDLARRVAGARNQSALLAAVHPDKRVRTTAEKSVEVLSGFLAKLATRQDLYCAIQDVSPERLDGEARRFREKELMDFRLAGIELPERDRKKVQALSNQITKLGQAFDGNIRDDVRYIDVDPSALEGLPSDYIRSHPPTKKGTVRLSTQYPDFLPFMEYSKSSSSRKKFQFLNANRGWPKNGNILLKLLSARQKQARLLGFAHWADYITADKMIGSGKNV